MWEAIASGAFSRGLAPAIGGLDCQIGKELAKAGTKLTRPGATQLGAADGLASHVFHSSSSGLNPAGEAGNQLQPLGGGSSSPGNPWNFNPKVDQDLRSTGKSYKDALDEAFRKTGVSRDEFEPTKWGRDKYGKSFPSEYRVRSGANRGAEVNVDIGHTGKGPEVPHVGYQTPGKRGGGALRGHILVDDVPFNR